MMEASGQARVITHTVATLASTLLFQASIVLVIGNYLGEDKAVAAADLSTAPWKAETQFTAVASPPAAPSFNNGDTELWRRPHEVVFTSREALQENNIPMDRTMSFAPANRVALPNVMHHLQPREVASLKNMVKTQPLVPPKMTWLVVLPAKSSDEMLSDGRCQQGNRYLKVRPIRGSNDDALELEVEDLFLPSMKTWLKVHNVFVKGDLEYEADALLVCDEAGGKPVLVSLSPPTTSIMPRFTAKPFSLWFKPQRMDIFQSTSPNVAVLKVVGAGETGLASDGEADEPEQAVTYVARLDGPIQVQAPLLFYNITEDSTCHIEREQQGEPVTLRCDNWNSLVRGMTSRKGVIPATKRLTSRNARTVGDKIAKHKPGWKALRVLVPAVLSLLLMYMGISNIILSTKNRGIEEGMMNFNDGFQRMAGRWGMRSGIGSLILDTARPSNVYRAATHLLSGQKEPRAQRFSAGVLQSGLGAYTNLAALAYAASLLYRNSKLSGEKKTGLSRLLRPTLSKAQTSSTESEELTSQRLVIYAVAP